MDNDRIGFFSSSFKWLELMDYPIERFEL